MKIEIDIPLERVAALLSCAFESGGRVIDQWAVVTGKYKVNGKDFDSIEEAVAQDPEISDEIGEIASRHTGTVWLPLVEGCGVEIVEHNDSVNESDWTRYTLDLEAVRRGLNLFPKEAPVQFANFLREQEDVFTGDVFLQLCVFGELRYE